MKKVQGRSAGRLIFAFREANPASRPLTGGCWEAEEQVDLEWFDPECFFAILLRQSLSVTTKLSQTKEEVSGEAGEVNGVGSGFIAKRSWLQDREPKEILHLLMGIREKESIWEEG